jgi:hypothetical protein
VQRDEQLMDLLGVCFLGDLPAQIPDGFVVYSGHSWNWSSPGSKLFYDVKIMSLSSRFPRASALVAVNCGLAVLAFGAPQSRATGGNNHIPNNFQVSNILKLEGFIVKATSTRAFLDTWHDW